MTSATILALLVVLPLAAALLATLWPTRGRDLALLAALVTTGVNGLLLLNLSQLGSAELALGGWAPPLGIRWLVDGASAAFITLSTVVMLAILLYARSEFATSQRDGQRQAESFWPLALLVWAGLNVIFTTNDLFNAYVGLELLSLAAIGLVVLPAHERVLAAGLRYLGFALLGSLLYLLGVALLYSAHGTLDISLLAARGLSQPGDTLALALMTAGLAAKTALFPFHAWLPPAHSGAPAPASAILSSLVPKASFFLILRLWFEMRPELASAAALNLLAALGAIAVVYGSLLALRQTRLKLLIAYSTVAQIGYLFLVFPLAGGSSAAQPWAAGAWTGVLFHAVSHGLAKAAMFLCAGLWLRAVGHDRIEGLRGIVGAMPITVLAFALAAVTLMGLPPSGGFTAKYLMLTAAFAAGQWWVAAVIVLGGLLAALYLYRPIALAFTSDSSTTATTVSPGVQCLPLTLALAAIVLGIASAWPFELWQIGRPTAATEGLE